MLYLFIDHPVQCTLLIFLEKLSLAYIEDILKSRGADVDQTFTIVHTTLYFGHDLWT